MSMLKNLVNKIFKEIILDALEKKFVDFISKLFNQERLPYFTKINNQVNGVVKKVKEIYDYIEPLLGEAKIALESGDTKYIDDLLTFVNKEFIFTFKGKEYSLEITRENIISLINKGEGFIDGSTGAWKRENAVRWVIIILNDIGVEVKNSLIRASIEMAVQVLKDEEEK